MLPPRVGYPDLVGTEASVHWFLPSTSPTPRPSCGIGPPGALWCTARHGAIYTGSLNDLPGDYNINERLAPAGSPLDTLDLMFNWHLPASAGIVIDGDSASLDMDFSLSQDR